MAGISPMRSTTSQCTATPPDAEARKPFIEIKGLQKNYGAFRAVKGVDLDLASGEFVALLGPSGCGKTTVLRCVAGLEPIHAGSISIAGRVVSSPGNSMAPEKRGIGMVFQSYAIWPHMTVFENVAFGLRSTGIPKSEFKERVEAALELVQLSGLGNRDATMLSGGQMQRVAVARAVAFEPQVLLFDEPLSNLDAKLRERMRFDLRELQQRLGITSLYVTHDQQEAMVVADRVALMDAGKLVQMSAPRELYEKPANKFAALFIGIGNFLKGTVTASAGGPRLRMENGIELSVAGAHDARRGGEKQAALLVRPEAIQLSDAQGGAGNSVRATVSRTTYLGNMNDIYVDMQGVELRIQCSPPRLVEAGQSVWLRLPPESMVILDDDADISPEDLI
jgi:ABC-type Fe3+/spermidine/putrescine transport system ATPase subunit